MYSEYPGISVKHLPGDLVVEFSSDNQELEFPIMVNCINRRFVGCCFIADSSFLC